MSCLRDMKGVVAMGVASWRGRRCGWRDSSGSSTRCRQSSSGRWQDYSRPTTGRSGLPSQSFIDVIGRIPTFPEIEQYQKWPKAKRRELLLDRLFKDKGLADRWTIFYADLLRIRSRAEGQPVAGVCSSIQNKTDPGMRWRELIAASGSSAILRPLGSCWRTTPTR